MMKILQIVVCTITLLFPSCYGSFNICDFDAVESEDTWRAALRNTNALNKALLAANASSVDRTVLIPYDKVFYFKNLTVYDLYDVTLVVDGTLRLNNDVVRWNEMMGGKKGEALHFSGCEGIRLTGMGTFDGQGLEWWRVAYLGVDFRPHFIEFYETRDIVVDSVTMTNAPSWSLIFRDCADVVVHDMTIFIDSSLTRHWNGTHDSVTYPLNTDGIDIFAYNVTIYNINMTNYDDAFVAKPCRSNWKYCQCSGNINVYDSSVSYSTGLAIGSVPPNDENNCVRGVTFRNITMYRPLKALYIKSNPGDNGIGTIEDITFEDIFIQQALWWTVWIGPQQQNQPGGGQDGTGCNFLFPYVPICPTNPLVSFKKIVLKNILAVETLPLFQGPGVVLCDPENPCEEVVFHNVTNKPYTGNSADILHDLPFDYLREVVSLSKARSDLSFGEYISANAYGKKIGEVSPDICLEEGCWWEAEI